MKNLQFIACKFWKIVIDDILQFYKTFTKKWMDDKTDFSVEIAKHEYQLENAEQKI